ncbi:unnamed protein product [Symbiodinium sp. CCMP2592]|nr:unnamed protein product [Symbiodinium sp. CCMP2592]
MWWKRFLLAMQKFVLLTEMADRHWIGQNGAGVDTLSKLCNATNACTDCWMSSVLRLRQPEEQYAPFAEAGVEEMVERLRQQNELLEQRELERVDLEQRLTLCEQEEHSCKDTLARERELQQHHDGSLRSELVYEKKQFDMLREQHESGLTRAEEEIQRREATWHRERLQCEEAEDRVRVLEKQCGPGEERLQQCEDMFERECRKRVEAEDCLRERETMEQQRNDVAQRAIQKLEQEVAAAEDRAELLHKEVVTAEEERQTGKPV